MEGNIVDHQSFSQHLKTLDKVLRCKVCRNHLSNAACLPACGHSCCRQCLAGKVRCPECHIPIPGEENSVVLNRALNEMVHSFKQLPIMDKESMSKKWAIPKDDEPPLANISEENDIFQEYRMPQALQSVFQSLSCDFCGQFYSSAVCLRVCGHSVCSFCIRQVFQNNKTGIHRQKNQCLTCRTEVGENADKQLVINRKVQEAVYVVKDIVRSLHGINNTSGDSRNHALRSRQGSLIDTKFPSMNYDRMKPRDLREICLKYGLPSRGGR